MLLDKKTYEDYTRLVKEKNYEDFERRLDKLNETLIINYVQDYLSDNDSKIKSDLKNINKYKKLFSNTVTDWVSYRVGTFDAILFIFELLVYKKDKKDDFIKRIRALSTKKYMDKIFMFLYKNPDAQHKVISQNIGVKPNYLCELMRELEKSGCVERYMIGKRSFYSLSKPAKEFISQESLRKQNEGFRYKSNGYLKYDAGISSHTNFLVGEKYVQTRSYKMKTM